jgi:FtsH-binding integral membrane protein
MMCYTGFVGSMSLCILPLIQIAPVALVCDAALATGCSMAALSTVAYMAPSEQYLMWGGALSIACGGMFAVSMLSILYPQSQALFNIWLYGGLVLCGGLTLFRMQKMIHDAKTQYKYDPIRHAVGFYSDSVNMFIRFLLIFMNNKNKK